MRGLLPRRGWILVMPAIGGVPAVAAGAGDDEPLRNRIGAPFFQVCHGVPACAQPLGPFITRAEMLRESHPHAERGTSCWLAGCARPNAYFYDPGVAAAVRERFEAAPLLRDASLWVMVQRRDGTPP
jgi:hypothetical protein